MALLPALLYLLTIAVYLSHATTPEDDGCVELPTPGIIELLLENNELFNTGEGVPDVTFTSEITTSCLAAGRIRGRYRFVTHIVTATSSTVSGVVIADFSCQFEGGDELWMLEDANLVTDVTEISLLQSENATVTDCVQCTSIGLDPANDDVIRHCDRCNSLCLEEDLRLCWMSGEDGCCNVYVDDVCMVECPPNFAASSATNFECECNLQCQNGVVNDTTECNMCICEFGFTGDLCDVRLNPCDPNQCVNGACIPGTFPDFNCTCDLGFMGDLCDVPLDPCVPDQCVNGTCIPGTFPDFACDCDFGFTGDLCDVPLNPCDPNQCVNGACIPGTFPNFTCNCDFGFTGDLCDVPLDPCVPDQCVNGACIPGTFPDFTCDCIANFDGPLCENCILANCENCSLTSPGVCERCSPGFLLAEGQCIIDCTICESRSTNFSQNICEYYCQLNSWSTTANSCDLIVPPTFVEPTSLSNDQIYAVLNTDATTTEQLWVDGATDRGIVDAEQPDRGATLEQWRIASTTYLNSLDAWLTFIRSGIDPDFPEYNIAELIALLSGDEITAYQSINKMWLSIVADFNNRIASLPDQCNN